MAKLISLLPIALCAPLLLAACQQTKVVNAPGTPTHYQDPTTPGPAAGVGIEGQDIVSMTDMMMRDILTSTDLSQRGTAPRVIVDSVYFTNESSQRLNKNQIVDRLRVGLQRAAGPRIAFVNRERVDMVAAERDLKRTGTTDLATSGLTKAQAGADYRLSGRITSLDARSSSGMMQRYSQITFELTDLESGLVIWTNLYEFTKAAQDDVVYR